MAFWSFTDRSGKQVQTCPASLGSSFAAGTTDGPGFADFTQGQSGQPNNPLWQAVAGLLRTPTAEQKACQQPKPVLLDVGEMDSPYAWSANIVDIQTFRVGQLILIPASPEVATMAGRRWREAVAAASGRLTDEKPIVIVGGPANTYSVSRQRPNDI
jgi:neutral ceramidase